MCIIICEHQARELSIVDRALILSNCKIIAEGSPRNVLKDEQAKSQYFGNFLIYNHSLNRLKNEQKDIQNKQKNKTFKKKILK